MAAGFWTLEDGRQFARRWSAIDYALKLITDELKEIEGAKDFYDYLEKFILREENGDIYNGFGGLIRGDQNIMFKFDLRTFAPKNREYFWQAAQLALTKLKVESKLEVESESGSMTIQFHLTDLLDMHKRIKRGEDPMLFNDVKVVYPETGEKNGPGWQ